MESGEAERVLPAANSDAEEEHHEEELTDNGTAEENGTAKEDMEAPIVLKPLSKKKLEQYQQEYEKRGVVYLSRIPPGMTPDLLRRTLSPVADIDRIYLTPEDPARRKVRRKGGGSGKLRYRDGWVEFRDKKQAKLIAKALNNTPIGGPKRCPFRDDLWTMKYLPGFKWNHLTDKIAYQRRVREAKLRAELAAANRENEVYLKRVERARVRDKIKEKKLAKGKITPEELEQNELKDIRRSFRQREALEPGTREDASIDELLEKIKAPSRKRPLDAVSANNASSTGATIEPPAKKHKANA